MAEQSTPVPEDPRTHAQAPAEGETADPDTDAAGVREHPTDPAEGADDAV